MDSKNNETRSTWREARTSSPDTQGTLYIRSSEASYDQAQYQTKQLLRLTRLL